MPKRTVVALGATPYLIARPGGIGEMLALCVIDRLGAQGASEHEIRHELDKLPKASDVPADGSER